MAEKDSAATPSLPTPLLRRLAALAAQTTPLLGQVASQTAKVHQDPVGCQVPPFGAIAWPKTARRVLLFNEPSAPS